MKIRIKSRQSLIEGLSKESVLARNNIALVEIQIDTLITPNYVQLRLLFHFNSGIMHFSLSKVILYTIFFPSNYQRPVLLLWFTLPELNDVHARVTFSFM